MYGQLWYIEGHVYIYLFLHTIALGLVCLQRDSLVFPASCCPQNHCPENNKLQSMNTALPPMQNTLGNTYISLS